MIKSITCAMLVGSAVLLTNPGVYAQDEDPQELYASLFGDREKKVSTSRSFDDDLEFAQELMQTATDLEDAPELQLLLFAKVIELAEKRPAGYETAVGASEKLIEMDAERISEWEDKLLELGEKRYRTASRTDRPSVGHESLQIFIEIGEARLKRGDVDGAREAWVEGMSQARILRDNDTRDMLKNRMSDLRRVAKLNERIEELQKLILDGEGSADQAKELSLIYLLDLNNPKDATTYLPFSQDGPFIASVKLLTGQMGEDEEPELKSWLSAAQLFVKLAEAQESQLAEAVALNYAMNGYTHFLDNSEEKDMTVLRAGVEQKRVKQRLDELIEELGEVSVASSSGIGRLGKRVDLMKVGMFGKVSGNQLFTLDERGNILTNQQGRTSTRFPVNPKGNYTITLEATKLTPQRNGITLILPVADGKLLTVFIDGFNGNRDGYGRFHTRREWVLLNHAGERATHLTTNKKAVIQVKINQANDKLALLVMVDGKEILNVEDIPTDLRTADQDSAAKTDEIHLSTRNQFRINKFELVMDSGKAEYSQAYQDKANLKELELWTIAPNSGQAGWGRVGLNGQLGYGGGIQGKVVVEGKPIQNALSMHAAETTKATVEYLLDGRFKRFTGIVGFNDSASQGRPCVFRIFADDKLIWQSRAISKGDFEKFNVNISKAKSLKLQVQSQVKHNGSHSLWIKPLISK